MDINIQTEKQKFSSEKKEKTFQYDESLPNLPLPPLEQTLRKYLDSVRPHVTDVDFRTTKKIVANFSQGIGIELHSKLVQRANQQRNWLERWWEDYAYLFQRYPILPLCNMAGAYPIETMWPPEEGSAIPRASLIIYHYLRYWQLLRSEKFAPQWYKEKPMCMNQWRRLYNCCRIPGEVKDSIVECFVTESEGPAENTHIVVLHRGRIFVFDAVDSSGNAITYPEIASQLQFIHDQCRSVPYGPSIGALTCDDRTSWHKNRQVLVDLHPDNRKFLHCIESSLFAVVLDEHEPRGENESLLEAIGGDIKNRWADKSNTLIAHANGLMASNSDHSAFDAMVTFSLNYYTYLFITECNGVWQGSMDVRSLPMPSELNFHIDDSIAKSVENSVNQAQSVILNVELQKPLFRAFGKDFITAQNRHPDTFLQLALQLGYYRLHHRPAPTYETATTRFYWHGRTETVRSCTPEAIRWAAAMLNRKASAKKKLHLMDAAFRKHNELMDEAMNNQGCDRHLLGLYITAMEDGIAVPDIFTDPAFIKSGGNGNFILSTSLSGYTVLHGGVPPMCDNGYGVFYALQQNSIRAVVTAWRSCPETSAKELHASICQSLLDMQKLLITANL